jgi:hypothetical protein
VIIVRSPFFRSGAVKEEFYVCKNFQNTPEVRVRKYLLKAMIQEGRSPF